ncbi:MAG: Altronate hydrolase [Bacteroidota bacterium]
MALHPFLQVHPRDNALVALTDLSAGRSLPFDNKVIVLRDDIPVKHKFTVSGLSPGDPLIMYGVVVGRVTVPIPAGGRITRENVVHAASEYQVGQANPVLDNWSGPDVSRYLDRSFPGYKRKHGRAGTRNHWLVVPMVFCENRNIQVMRSALLEPLGYISERSFAVDVNTLVAAFRAGAGPEDIRQLSMDTSDNPGLGQRVFPNVDGIKFLTHDGGCGGTQEDSDMLCRLLAGYIAHPNVAGATVLSLGCQHAQLGRLERMLYDIAPWFDKPLFLLEQQKSRSERKFIAHAIRETFAGLAQANQLEREPISLQELCLGLECGGSDGFSGITANPALGQASDILVASGGTTILSEFPELHGVEQELVNRCARQESALKFQQLMQDYARRAAAVGSGFDMNPSPGNIRDGLITDAMKSAGAARKGGTAPVSDVLDYAQPALRNGLNLLCTPGNDVESTTGLAGSGANLIVFTTGLGTPTGNPVAPTIKMSSNTRLAKQMPDLIDIDAGTIVSGDETIESVGTALLELMIAVAGGQVLTRSERLGQDDFIPWKRGVSL